MQKIIKNNELINKLITQTREKKLAWTITSKPNKYTLVLNRNQIVVEYSNKLGINQSYEFIIYDIMGNIVEKLTYTEGFIEQSFPNIKALYNAIKIDVDQKIGNVIDSIITEIG